MILQKLAIEKERYGENKGQYTGTARFSNNEGAIDLKLTPEHCDQIFKVCADSILTTAKSAAENLTCSVIEHKKLLETPAQEDEE